MTGKNLSIAAVGTVVLLAVIVVWYGFGGGRVADTPDVRRDARGERQDALAEIEKRLARLEEEVAALRVAPSASSPNGRGEPAADADGRWATVESALSTLQLRVAGLEEDPVRRGFAYLQSEDPELRREGINTLDRVAGLDPEARAAIRSLLGDPSARVREQAAQKLRDLKDKESAPQMVALLSDPDSRTRRRAVEALGAIGASEAAREIGRNLVSDPDDAVRRAAAEVLGRLKSPEAAEVLAQTLKDPGDAIRGEVIAALGEIGATSVAPDLRAIYDQDPGQHRLQLALALKRCGDEVPLQREVTRLSDLAKTDADERVREQAIRELSILARDSAQPVFSQALEDPSPRVRRAAEKALR
jgi:HEAT repeat protein